MKIESDMKLEEEEIGSLIKDDGRNYHAKTKQSSSSSSKLKQCFMLLAAASILSYVILHKQGVQLLVPFQQSNLTKNQGQNNNHAISYSCPSSINKAKNDKDEDLVEWYDKQREEERDMYQGNDDTSRANNDTKEHIEDELESVYPTNMTQTDIQTILNNHYDASDWTYNEFKPFMYKFKSKYASLLKSGDSIFESACGIGLNLLMTVDVLQESANIDDLKVHGIEYRASSTTDANNILPQLLLSLEGGVGDGGLDGKKYKHAQLGNPICRGDATDLYYIPSNSFDLAFTGYIEPIQDPINLKSELGRDVEWEDLCINNHKTTAKGALDQAAVEDWYAKWVSELIRIAKPGQPIGIEQVSKPTCQDDQDWGGVAKKWWAQAVDKYQWDVNVTSIYMSNVYPKNAENRLTYRYNVYMEKNL